MAKKLPKETEGDYIFSRLFYLSGVKIEITGLTTQDSLETDSLTPCRIYAESDASRSILLLHSLNINHGGGGRNTKKIEFKIQAYDQPNTAKQKTMGLATPLGSIYWIK